MNHNTNDRGHSFYTKRINTEKTNPKVYDIFFENAPFIHNNELELFSNYIYPFLVLFYVSIKTLAFKEIFWNCLIVLLLRALSIRSTILPSSDKKCEINKNSLIGSCYDKLFSGHFAIVLVTTLVGLKYNVFPIYSAVLINFINAFIILLCRFHYTNDILMALYAGLTVNKLIIPYVL